MPRTSTRFLKQELVRIPMPFKPVWAIERSRNFLQEYLTKSGVQNLVIGNSGGIDSTVSQAIAVLAVGAKNVFSVMMPYGSKGNESVRYAELTNNWLSIPLENRFTVDIKPASDASAKSLGWTQDMTDSAIFLGNIMARQRMIVLYHIAKKHRAIVDGTENRTEHYLKYFTQYGDSGTDIEALRWLFKTQIWQLAVELGAPQEIIDRAPTAGLWDDQTDEGELGFTYQEADQILFCKYDLGESLDQIIARGFDPKLVRAVFERDAKYEYKLHVPVTLEETAWWTA